MRGARSAGAMAGAVSKTFGSILTVLGGLALVLGLAAVGWGVTAIESESQRTFPDGERMDAALAVFVAGLVGVGLGYLLLLVGIPLLAWGMARVRDPATGEVVTTPGGALKAWGVTFLLLGVVALLAGIVAFAFGAGVVDEETRRMFPNDDRAEAAAGLAVGGMAVGAFGLLLVLLGIPFLVVGASRARDAAARGRVPRSADPSGRTAAAIVGGAAALALLLILSFGGVGFGGIVPTADPDDPREVVTESFEGELQGGRAPVLGEVGAGASSRSHEVSPRTRVGVVEAVAEWEGDTRTGPMRLVLEAQADDGSWRVIGGSDGGAPLAAKSGAETLPGKVRATLSFGENGGGAISYTLVVSVSPA